MATQIRPITDGNTWLEWRRGNLNASEVAACFGLHPFLSLAQLVALKRGVEGLGPDPESAIIKRGHALEDDCAAEISKKHPEWDISKCTNYYVNEHRLAATPDYLLIDPARKGAAFGLAQIKVVAAPVFRREWVANENTPPIHVVLQTAQEMLLTDVAWGVVAALVIGDFSYDVHLFPIERNRDAEARLIAAADEFWRAFDAGEDPPFDYARDGKLIAALFPAEKPGTVVDLTGDNELPRLLDQRELLREAAKDCDNRLEAVESQIRHKLRDAESAIVAGWRVTFKTQKRKAYQVAETTYRVLRTTRIAHGARP